MKRWDCRLEDDVENKKADDFLLEIIGVCKKHGLSLSHEDYHGGFEIEDYDEELTDWLLSADIPKTCESI